MSSVHASITPPVAAWIARQQMFTVATAPLTADGHVNVSPKGLDSLRILDPMTVAYLDLTGSGVETIAHVRENGRITLMWTALDGPAADRARARTRRGRSARRSAVAGAVRLAPARAR